MRIGVAPVTAVGGGVYQYSLTVLEALDSWVASGSHDELVALSNDAGHPAVASLPASRWSVQSFGPPTIARAAALRISKAVGEGRLRESLRLMRSRVAAPAPRAFDRISAQPAVRKWLEDLGIELMIYPTHDNLSFESGLPYIQAIHDLQHRLHPQFPEVSANGEWERREYTLRNIARRATLLLADSEIGKEDILNCYGDYIDSDRVKVLPFLPANYLNPDVTAAEKQLVRLRYRLPERFVLYPAQFWPHKNHLRIVQALGLIRAEHGVEVPIVMCGSKTGELRRKTFRDVVTMARRLRVDKNIRFIDYVPNQDMSALYATATALVMPTFFGPTNIPPIEAALFGCPVLTSDIRGIREQVGDGAILVDPESVESIADGISQLWEDERLGEAISTRLRERLGSYTRDDFRNRLIQVVEEAKSLVGARKSSTRGRL